MSNLCDTCTHYKRHIGECRRFPPQPVYKDKDHLEVLYPKVGWHLNCGEWKRIEK